MGWSTYGTPSGCQKPPIDSRAERRSTTVGDRMALLDRRSGSIEPIGRLVRVASGKGGSTKPYWQPNSSMSQPAP